MEYKVTANRKIVFHGINRKPETKTIVHYYEADCEWKAIDMMKHDLFADAKLYGYQLFLNDPAKNEIGFKGDITVYGIGQQWTQFYLFNNFKAVKENADE